jgi:hypothetical protein
MALIVAPVEIVNHRFRSGPSGIKDHLDNDAARAAELGLSYGNFKALEWEGLLPTKPQPSQEEREGIEPTLAPPARTAYGPNGKKRKVHVNHPPRPCLVCGNMFAPHAINAKYCSPACKATADAKHRVEANRRARAKKKEAKA